jgi:GNAT superfamily N-acetyltransferase
VTNNLGFVPVGSVDSETKRDIAAGIYALDAGFYGLLFTDKEQAINKIAQSLDEPGGDLGCGFVACDDKRKVGYLSYFPMAQKTTRNLATLKALLDFSLPQTRTVFKQASTFQQQLSPVTIDCLYLNKIMVFNGFKGKSYGSLLLNGYLADAKKLGLTPMFHVHRDNQSAISFYKKQGFEVENSGFEYLLCKLK